MKQSEVKRLLEKAVGAKSKKVRSNILKQLVAEMASGVAIGGVHHMIFQLVEALYWRTLRRNPDHLPKLFPVFALLCGKRKSAQYLLAEAVEWSLAK